MELLCTVSRQVREMEISRAKDQGVQINHVSVRQDKGRGHQLWAPPRQSLPSLGEHMSDMGTRTPLHGTDL